MDTYIQGEDNFILFYIWVSTSPLSKIHGKVKRVICFIKTESF